MVRLECQQQSVRATVRSKHVGRLRFRAHQLLVRSSLFMVRPFGKLRTGKLTTNGIQAHHERALGSRRADFRLTTNRHKAHHERTFGSRRADIRLTTNGH